MFDTEVYMSTDGQVLVTMNPFGYGIKEDDVERILNPNTEIDKIESEHVAYFFNLPIDKLTRELLSRYAKVCEVMTNVSVGSFNEHIRTKLIKTIASAKKCYSYGEDLACIELCALHGEMLTNYLCIVHEQELKDENIINKLNDQARREVRKSLKENNFYDRLWQATRINWIVAGNLLSEQDAKDLKGVHSLRVEYFHHWGQGHGEVDKDALSSMVMISRVASKHLEILDKPDNISKIRAYMDSHLSNQQQ